MNDPMNEYTQFSPFAGKLHREIVPGEASRKVEHENDVHAADGQDRTMYAYAPVSGCPDPKQCQVMMVLREDDGEESAQALLTGLGLDALAEEEHFLVLFPNPTKNGWNADNNPQLDNDMDYLGRCFGVLRQSETGVGGFNGMIYYVAAGQKTSALLMTMAALRPLSVPAMVLGAFPEGYAIPQNALNVETAAWVIGNPVAEAYLKAANGVSSEETSDGVTIYYGTNPNVRLAVTERPLGADTLRLAWDRLLCLSRRWQNDTYGTYQKRTAFTQRGFTAHRKDTTLGCNNGLGQTWYEYIPPQLRGTKEKVPLVFYFHGINCVPLYGAEQSNWHDVADRENLIVVYPAPSVGKAWNIFADPNAPSDFEFVLALIEHMKQVHPIDETRIYATGFSMGGMMTHALCGLYPEVFAAGAPCNAYDFGYFLTAATMFDGQAKEGEVSVLHQLVDEKWAKRKYHMPIFQNAGYNDATICLWPIDETTDDIRTKTLANWKRRNGIPETNVLDAKTHSGLAADESFYEEGGRLYHQKWRSADPGSPVLLEQLLCDRMPHAIVPQQIVYAWQFIRRFRRQSDGSLWMDDKPID